MTTAEQTNTAPEMVPAAALTATQTALDSQTAATKDAEERAAASAEVARLADEATAALRTQLAAAEALNVALEAKRAAAEERAEAVSKDANISRSATKERYRILVYAGRDSSDPPRVSVQVNGRAYDLQREVDLDVPLEVVSVLQDAVVGRASSQEDIRGNMSGVSFSPATRFPFRMFGQSKDADGKYLPGFEPAVEPASKLS